MGVDLRELEVYKVYKKLDTGWYKRATTDDGIAWIERQQNPPELFSELQELHRHGDSEVLFIVIYDRLPWGTKVLFGAAGVRMFFDSTYRENVLAEYEKKKVTTS